MSNLLTDRTKVLPLLAVMVAIALGATLIILLTSGPASGGSAAAAPSSSGGGGGSTGPARGGAGKTVKVKIADFKYKPVQVTVKAGTKVAWSDTDSSNHTVTGKGFDTGSISKGQTKSVTFKKPGTYKYMCTFHPFMHGTIVVK